jgi:hypothetical protein
MKTFLRFCTLAASIGVASSQAQEPPRAIAQLKEVHGNVLVSKESGLASGDEGLRLTPGTRVITTANADAIVAYDNGCEVKLKENQRFEVQEGKACAALIAQAASILMEPAGAAVAATATGGAVFAATLPALGGALVGLGILQGEREKQVVSPN